MYLLSPVILLNYKKNLEWIQSYKVDPFLGPKWPIFSKKKKSFFRKTIKLIFMYLLAPFIMQNLKKKTLGWIQSYDNAPFAGQNGPFAPNDIFLTKTINISSMYLLAPFHCVKFQTNFYKRSRVMRMHHFQA